jgi:hypothetical protein
MTKFFIGVFCFVAIFIANNAMALEPLDSDTLKETTAQSGISIIFDDIVLETWTGTILYTDTDGTGDGKAASLVISDQHSVMTIQAITGSDLKKRK